MDNLPNNPISEYTCSHGDPLMRNPCLMIKKSINELNPLKVM